MLRLAQRRDQSRGGHCVAGADRYFRRGLFHADPSSYHRGGEERVDRRPSRWFSCAWEASSNRYARMLWHEGRRTVARTSVGVINLVSATWVVLSGRVWGGTTGAPLLLREREWTSGGHVLSALIVGRRSSVVGRLARREVRAP